MTRFGLRRRGEKICGVLHRALQFGLAHEGALDEPRRRAGFSPELPPPPAVEPSGVLGSAQLDPSLREGLLRAAEAARRRRP